MTMSGGGIAIHASAENEARLWPVFHGLDIASIYLQFRIARAYVPRKLSDKFDVLSYKSYIELLL